MADESPPGSPLSVLSSDAFEAEEEHERLAAMPPAKRQKLGNSLRGTPVPLQDDDNDAYVSSDTDGDIPTPPSHLRVDDDDIHEQITKCNWEGCQMVLPDTDKLVTHINNEHIEGRSKKYTCEWMNCGRKGQTHASGYALKSHMRSHTREKPFFCLLPGKSFNPIVRDRAVLRYICRMRPGFYALRCISKTYANRPRYRTAPPL